MYKLIVVGGILLFLGAFLPFLMVIRVLPTTFFISITAAASSIIGFITGFLGIVDLYQSRKNDRR